MTNCVVVIIERKRSNLPASVKVCQMSRRTQRQSWRGVFLKRSFRMLWKTRRAEKDPGIDGLPVEFHREFWAVLGKDSLAVLNESLAERSLRLSCRRAVITLLPKMMTYRRSGDLWVWCVLVLKTLANRLGNAMGRGHLFWLFWQSQIKSDSFGMFWG